MIEVLKQMQEALREYHYYTIDAGLPNQSMLNKGYAAYQAGLKAIAELESQERNFCPRCGKRTNDIHTCTPPRNIEQEGKQMIDWYSVEGETRSYGVGMVACVYAIGRDEVVHVVTHESVKDIAMQHLPIQRTWQGLTDEDKHYLNEVLNLQGRFPVIEAIEAKLKERNNA